MGLRLKVQVKNGLEWETEQAVFNCLDGAIRFADNRFPQNEWQIVDKTGKIHGYSSPLAGLQTDAIAELQRFRDVQAARDFFARQKEQRDTRRHREQEQRLQEQMERTRRQQLEDHDFLRALAEMDDDDRFVSDPIEDVCWWKEGF